MGCVRVDRLRKWELSKGFDVGDKVPLYSMHRELQNVSTVFLDCTVQYCTVQKHLHVTVQTVQWIWICRLGSYLMGEGDLDDIRKLLNNLSAHTYLSYLDML